MQYATLCCIFYLLGLYSIPENSLGRKCLGENDRVGGGEGEGKSPR